VMVNTLTNGPMTLAPIELVRTQPRR
jgi:hypothetical protein